LSARRLPHVLVRLHVCDDVTRRATKRDVAAAVVAMVMRVEQVVYRAILRTCVQPLQQRGGLRGELAVDDGDATIVDEVPHRAAAHGEDADIATEHAERRLLVMEQRVSVAWAREHRGDGGADGRSEEVATAGRHGSFSCCEFAM
jgi:hypothetical protein